MPGYYFNELKILKITNAILKTITHSFKKS